MLISLVMYLLMLLNSSFSLEPSVKSWRFFFLLLIFLHTTFQCIPVACPFFSQGVGTSAKVSTCVVVRVASYPNFCDCSVDLGLECLWRWTHCPNTWLQFVQYRNTGAWTRNLGPLRLVPYRHRSEAINCTKLKLTSGCIFYPVDYIIYRNLLRSLLPLDKYWIISSLLSC